MIPLDKSLETLSEIMESLQIEKRLKMSSKELLHLLFRIFTSSFLLKIRRKKTTNTE